MHRGLFSDAQPEVGQDIAGGVNQVAVFVKINCADGGGFLVVHQVGSVHIKFHHPPMRPSDIHQPHRGTRYRCQSQERFRRGTPSSRRMQ